MGGVSLAPRGGLVTGETAADIAASEERVRGALGAPVGRALGQTEKASHKENPARKVLGYVGEVMDAGATNISDTTGIPKSDVLNMMQSAMAVVPLKVPGGKLAGKATVATVNKLRDIIDPKTAFYRDIAEGRGAELVAAARNPAAEIVPGASPTFAQATAGLNMPRVAAVGEQAKTSVPGTVTRAQAIKDAQEAASVKQLQIIERTPAKRAVAENVRSGRADPLYNAAETAGNVVNVQPTLNYIDALIRTNPGNQPLLVEMRRLRRGLVEPGFDPQGNPIMVPRVNAREISSTLDGLKTALAKEDNRFIKSELTNIKDDLTAAIPYMREAQAAVRKGSRPVNQMDMAKYLREKLQSPLPEGAPRAGSFAQAVRDAPRTVKQALDGAPPYETLTEAGMSRTQQNMIDNIVIDLSRDARVKELAQAGKETAPRLSRTPGKMSIPPFFNAIVTVANEILRRVSGKITDKMAMDIAMEFLDANRAASAVETAMRRSGKRMQPARPSTSPPAQAPRRISKLPRRAPLISAPNQMDSAENRNAMAR